MFGKSKKVINLVIEDYVVRLLETPKKSLSPITLLHEEPLPIGMIDNGKIVDEMGLFELMKKLVKDLGIKKRQVRFYVPNAMILIREVKLPSDLKEKEMKEYIEFEIGQSIHLPFNNPVFDLDYQLSKDESSDKRKGMLYAAPKEEMMKYAEILADASLKPMEADVTALGLYRYFSNIYNAENENVYLFLQLNTDSLNVSIFNNHKLEFMRFQDLDVHLTGWKIDEELDEIIWEYKQDKDHLIQLFEDQIVELDRIINFYQTSMKQGKKSVSEILVLGDNPFLTEFYHQMKTQIDRPSRVLQGYISNIKDNEIGIQYIPALGLALKGVE